MTRIKICGITNVDDARCAAEAGADFLGFIFYPKSPRFVTPEQVGAITRTIRDEFGADGPRFVGVFVDESAERVRAVLDDAGLDMTQLHGDESPDTVRALSPQAFKAIRPQTLDEAEAAVSVYGDVAPNDTAAPQLLMDAYHPQQLGGTGILADLGTARTLAPHLRLMLAGGLRPEVVGSAIELVRPWGVDVSSGVERTKGIKDHTRVRAFVEAVRAANNEKG
ncbi:MAG: phosphoribosylanthranilate isomerase [Chloroflexi bacterium]|nr:phosphoribosylanthranilate isomerase [Chloroflexota bacterium]